VRSGSDGRDRGREASREETLRARENNPQMRQQGSDALAHWAKILAAWAERMPLRDIYIFGDHVRGDAAPGSKLKIAVEYAGAAGDETMRSWKQENASGFAELEGALGIQIALFTDQDHEVWGPIREAARAPLLTVGKVRVVRTPTL